MKGKERFFLLTIFGIAMGLWEAITVVYIREIRGSLLNIPAIEVAREAATLVILLMVAIISGKNSLQRFSSFIFTFAVWDILYYVGLKILINWPPSIMTNDHLFYIPIVWQAPVLAPILVSLLMIVLAFLIPSRKVNIPQWGLLGLGASIILLSFWWGTLWGQDHSFQYHWPMFGLGGAMIAGTEISLWRKTK